MKSTKGMNCCTVGRSRYSSDPKWIQIQNCPEPIATPLKVINTACSNRKHNVIPKTKNSSSSHRCIAITSTHLFLHSLSAVISSKTPPTPTQTHSLHRTHHPTTTTPPSSPTNRAAAQRPGQKHHRTLRGGPAHVPGAQQHAWRRGFALQTPGWLYADGLRNPERWK